MRKIIVILVGFLLVSGCKDEIENPQISFSEKGVLIANQGNFGWGEGSLSLYNPIDKTVQNDVFQNVNNQSLGNVFQSISQIGDSYFFVINNSGKIIITDSSYAQTDKIEGLTSPRYLYQVSNTKAYVTDLYADAISVIDLAQNQVIHSIPVNGWSERAVIKNQIFWFTASETNQIYGIDILTDRVIDSIQVASFPESIIIDNSNQLWVLCRGDEDVQEKAALLRIDETDESVDLQINIDETPTNLVFDQSDDILYYISEGVWSMKTNDSVPSLFCDGEGKTLYCIGIQPENGDLYVSDVKDFVSRSAVLRYNKQGILVDEFYTGIISGDFFFL